MQLWEPAQGEGVRNDSGIEAGSTIGIEFDPMIAKIIAHAPTRREAVAKLARALEATRIQGITHNRDFLVATLRTKEFLSGDTSTDFIERVKPPAVRAVDVSDLQAAAISAALHDRWRRRRDARVMKTIPGGFRNSVMPPETVAYSVGDQRLDVSYRLNRDGSFAFEVGEQACRVVERAVSERGIDLEIDGRRSALAVAGFGDHRYIHGPSGDIDLIELPRFPRADRAGSHGGLAAPMQGKVLSVMVKEGDRVERGQLLLVLEAMKMEHRIDAPWACTVKTLNVAEGVQVANGAMLVVLEQAES